MKTIKICSVILFALALSTGCGPKVAVPPTVDLSEYRTIGFIAFNSKTEGNFDEYFNERLLQEISIAQPRVELVELGTAAELLDEIGYRRLDRDAIAEIGRIYELDAVITGTLDISDIKPNVHVFRILSDFAVNADVEAKITARLVTTGRGATVWAATARDRKNVAHLSVRAGRPFFLYAKNPDEAYGKLVDAIVRRVTRDLRVRYVRR